MKTALRGTVLALLAAGALVACGDSAGPETDDDDSHLVLVGAWSFLSIDGAMLPIDEAFDDPELGACVVTLNAFVLTFNANRTFREDQNLTLTCDNDAEEPEPYDIAPTFGTFAVSGTALTINYSDATGIVGFEIAGDQMTFVAQSPAGPAVTSVLQKQAEPQP